MSKYRVSTKMLICLRVTVRDHHGRDHMVVEFTTTYAISAYHH